ncbi:MAG TPA: carboxylesterase family protein [Kofleriaceae bacterium]|nr:carboxylesterase family protein [Kofleriaceae bacterium]
MFRIDLSAVATTLCLSGLMITGCATREPDAAATDAVAQDVTSPSVAAPAGQFFGTQANGVRAFRGIRYAEPPVGALRWRPPVAAPDATAAVDARQFGAHCAQPASPFGVASTSEDCLNLNVYVPAHRQAFGGAPVVVWIHGGALITGESDDYDPTRLVKQGDVIVVTINYRLGALGFLAHPALTAESPDAASGNYGLMDQQLALRWVQRNILAFGGDPSRVTIAGESAGGLSVHAQLANNNKDDLFQGAIVESGAYQLDVPSLALAENAGVQLAVAAGCTDQSAACLRGLSVAQILASQNNGLGGATPVVDGLFLKRSIRKAFETGKYVKAAIVEGSNHDEWRLFQAQSILLNGPTPAAAYPAVAAALAASTASSGAVVPPIDQILATYPLSAYPSADDALAAIGSDAIFTCNARVAAGLLSGNDEIHPHAGTPTWVYEFDDPDAPERFLPPIPGFPYRAAHASELQYLFDLPTTVPAPALDADQQHLAKIMTRMWGTFAHDGHPGLDAPNLRWPFFPVGGEILRAPEPERDFLVPFQDDHHCALWGEASSTGHDPI